MALTARQDNDVEVARYFIPAILKNEEVTNEHIEQYLAVSERGESSKGKFDSNPLLQGKRNRGLHMQLWEEGVLEGTVPYYTLLEGMPAPVVEFMKKEMFKGADAKLIERVYAETL